MKHGLRFHVERRDYSRSYALYVAQFNQNGRSDLVMPTYKFVEEGLMMDPEPPFSLMPEEAQELMDQLYLAGIRPSEEGTAGQLAAIKYHLEDMRKLVFKVE